jgi:iron complex outermembrane receptor protein
MMPSKRTRLLASTVLIGAVFGAGASAQAQQASDQGTQVKEVVVTGSRIRQPNLTATSPVTSVGANEVKFEGTQRTEDLVNNLPQVFASQSSTVSNGSSGTATVDLRGLGTVRTLVLVDGRRLVPGDPSTPVADLNMIPAAMIERVDVLTGGASATYGADAVAGVVNFILKKNFEGIQIDANHSFVEHDNGDSFTQGLLNKGHATNPAQFNNPPGNYVGGGSTDINITMGASSPDGKGNVTAYLGYRQTEPVLESHYDYSACTLSNPTSHGSPAPGKPSCGGSGTTAPTHFLPNNGNSTPKIVDSKTGLLRTYNGSTDAFNFGPINYFQRNDTRYTGGYSAHYQVNNHFDAYSQFMFMDDQTTAQIAPSGAFGVQVAVPCNGSNPMYTADEIAQLCNPSFANYNSATNTSLTYILRRNVEGGPRQDNLHHTSFREVIGARGDIDDTWSYDVYGQYGQTNYSENYQNDMSVAREQEALNVVNNGGVWSCANPAAVAQGCAPWNIFVPGNGHVAATPQQGVTQAALTYLETPGFKSAVTSEQVVSGAFTGKLGNYGVQSPWAKEGVGVAIGGEYRRETLDYKVDSEFSTGDLAGQGGPTLPVSGAYSVKEMFLEARIPLISDRQFIQDLSLDTGYRRSDYTSSGTTDTYKIEGNWTPIHDLRFRMGFNRAVRAPNILELYSPQSPGLDGVTDPCAGTNPNAGCKYDPYFVANPGKLGLGTIQPNSANQYNGLYSGNANLKPEKADTFTLGTVITPRFIPGFSMTVDYYDIRVHQVIGNIGADNILNACYSTGASQFCNLIHRAANGSLWISPTGYVVDGTVNSGLLSTRGLDFQADYRLPLSKFGLENLGHLDFNFVGSDMMMMKHDPVTNSTIGEYDCVGKFGPACSASGFAGIYPEWRHKLRMTWVTPWKVDASLQWRYIGGTSLDIPKTQWVDTTLPAYNYFDLSADWRVRDNVTLRIGVNNLLDKDPPLIPGQLSTTLNNGNTAPGTYDALGRYIFTGLTATF